MIRVACAIIEHEGKVLATQRPLHKAEGGLWEFPGGKLEKSESPETCIIREIAEELSIQVTPYHQLNPAVHQYPTKTIMLIPLLCYWKAGALQLNEHASHQWVAPPQLPQLQWCPADLPVVAAYLNWLKEQNAH